MPRFRPIDAEKPATRPQKWNGNTYIRAEFNHRAALYIRRNEYPPLLPPSFFHPPRRVGTELTRTSTRKFNNEARIINRKRCKGLVAAGYDWPPNGLIRLVDPISGKACAEAPFRLQHFNSLPLSDFLIISIFYGLGWNPNLAPAVISVGPWHTRAEMIEEYRAFIGANYV
ncbi:uncharacterized protein LAJ45_00944 [Morchella importuna]|uniref:uncharacterized protein n=1 Tax=Morchella importuna TaxID=1174673 RepID=UPI001E8D10CD|nr:uncharacterized protein LAJ45_00944 [Morchella importuna]KAH8154417.1 hypothetical protein LAJ45_00944 [Morchella importuna]